MRFKYKLKPIVESLEYTYDDWQLYDKPGSRNVATVLNETFTKMVNSGASFNEVQKEMHQLMCRYGEFGADDSEPHWVLEGLLKAVFYPSEENW